MSVIRLSPVCLVLALATSALGTYPFAYPELRAAPLSFAPHLIYRSGISGGNADLTGFSYFTKDLSGGQSEVAFYMGPNSNTKVNEEIAALNNRAGLSPAITTELKLDGKITAGSMQEASKTASLVPVENKESAMAKNQDDTISTIAAPAGGDKNGQSLPAGGAGFLAPYPILRLGAPAAPFYPQFSGYSGYGPSDYLRSQYVPFVNNYNSYHSLYNPLYSSLNTDYYNPSAAVFPTLYHRPIFAVHPSVKKVIPEKMEGNILQKMSPIAPNVEKRIGGTDSEIDDKKIEGNSLTEKATDLPSTNEQKVEKAETVSETAPVTKADEVTEAASTASTTTADEVTEAASATPIASSTVADDAAAVA